MRKRKNSTSSPELSSEVVTFHHTNLWAVANASWELVLRPLEDFIDRKVTVQEYIDSLDMEPVVETHWGTRYRLSELMRYLLTEKMPEALPEEKKS